MSRHDAYRIRRAGRPGLSPYWKHKRAAHPRGIKIDIGRAVEIVSNHAIYEHGPKADGFPAPSPRRATLRVVAPDRRAAPLRPGQFDRLIGGISQSPLNIDIAAPHRQGAVFYRVSR